jgi:hypothetical protein
VTRNAPGRIVDAPYTEYLPHCSHRSCHVLPSSRCWIWGRRGQATMQLGRTTSLRVAFSVLLLGGCASHAATTDQHQWIWQDDVGNDAGSGLER